MKRADLSFKRSAAFLSAAALTVAMSGGVFAAAGTAAYIGEEKAKAIALEHAAVAEEDVVFIRTTLERDDGRYSYDVDFYSGDRDYDYEIGAVDGAVLEYSSEIEVYTNYAPRDTFFGVTVSNTAAANAAGGTVTNATAGNTEYIGDAEAKAIALTDANVAEADVSKMKIKLDRENKKMVYEVEFKQGQMEYEYEIDAVSGEITESDMEYDD